MMSIKPLFKNEKGNSAILVLGLLSVMVVLFVLVISFAGALVVKEQAVSTSQQAALAATATLYEELPLFIVDYEKELKDFEEEKKKEEEEAAEDDDEQPEEPEEPSEESEVDKTIDELIDEEVDKISGSMAGYTLNEIRNEAIDRILVEQLELGAAEDLFKKKMAEEMEHSWIKEMKESARSTILMNGGELEGAEMTVFDDGQVVIKSSHIVESAGAGGFFSGISENLYKTSRGPELKFVQKLSGWEGRTYSLE